MIFEFGHKSLFFSWLFFFLQQIQLICHISSSSVTINTILVCFSWPKVCTHKKCLCKFKVEETVEDYIDITYTFYKNVHMIVCINVYTPALWEEMHNHNYWFVKHRITLGILSDADTKNDQRSVERRLDQPLVLLVRQTLGDKHWVFPQGPRQEGESMRQVISQQQFLLVARCQNQSIRFTVTKQLIDILGCRTIYCCKLIESLRIMAYVVCHLLRQSSRKRVRLLSTALSSWRMRHYRPYCLHGWWLYLA